MNPLGNGDGNSLVLGDKMKVIPIQQAVEEVVVDEALLAPALEYSRRTAKVARYYERVRDGRNGAPVSIQVALTDRCYNRCIMCDHPLRTPREIKADQWLQFLAARGSAVESVCYSGGDPMAYRDFNRIMDYHINNDVLFGATITGYVPPFIDLERLRRAAWVRVSLDAVTPEVYAIVRGHTPVEKVLKGIDDMQRAGVNVCLGITVHKANEGDVPNVIDYAHKHGIHDIDVRPVYPESKNGGPGAERNIMPFNNCHAALYQLYIDADGAVYPCCITAGDTRDGPTAQALGNIAEPWDKVWASVVKFTRVEVENLPDICRTCCVQRLSEINHICGKLSMSKSFF